MPVTQPLILVVEDNSSIRDFACRLLRNATDAFVADAASPSAALSFARSIGRPIELLIADIELAADKSGVDLARELSRSAPAMNVLLMSAGNPPANIPSAWRFLEKPFPVTTFLDCVCDLCGAIYVMSGSASRVRSQSAA
jgi:DNA-binding NtrC family response regulator